MKKEELSQLVDSGMSTRQIASHFSLSQSTIKWWLKKHGLRTRYKEFYSKPHKCKHCGETREEQFYPKRKECCRACFISKDSSVGINKKIKAVAHMGGECILCGYNRHYSAMEFHHKNPKEKDSNWNSVRGWGWERIEEELKKCILVCSNCHREIHAGLHSEFGRG